jgi:predicted Na+-dependent transporter
MALPAPGAWLDQQRWAGQSVSSWLIALMFFVYGLRLQPSAWRPRAGWMAPASAALVVNLLLGPLAGLAVAAAVGAGEALTLGLLAMSSVPPTLSSGIVVTDHAEGNALAALFLTLLLTFTGLLVMPLILSWTLRFGLDLALPIWPFARRLAGLVLLPLIAGRLGQSLLGKRPLPGVLDTIPSLCVALVVYLPVSRHAGALLGLSLREWFGLAGTALAVHLLLLAAAAAAGRVLRIPRATVLPSFSWPRRRRCRWRWPSWPPLPFPKGSRRFCPKRRWFASSSISPRFCSIRLLRWLLFGLWRPLLR